MCFLIIPTWKLFSGTNNATLAELVDAVDSKSTVRKDIPVQVREVVLSYSI